MLYRQQPGRCHKFYASYRGGLLSPKSRVMLELFSSHARTYLVEFVHNRWITFHRTTKKPGSGDPGRQSVTCATPQPTAALSNSVSLPGCKTERVRERGGKMNCRSSFWHGLVAYLVPTNSFFFLSFLGYSNSRTYLLVYTFTYVPSNNK